MPKPISGTARELHGTGLALLRCSPQLLFTFFLLQLLRGDKSPPCSSRSGARRFFSLLLLVCFFERGYGGQSLRRFKTQGPKAGAAQSLGDRDRPSPPHSARGPCHAAPCRAAFAGPYKDGCGGTSPCPGRAMAAGRSPAAFSGAGQRSGLEVWRVESLELVPVPPSHHGDFFVGDAYVVLSTRRTATTVAYRLHYWLGGQPGVRDVGYGIRDTGWGRGAAGKAASPAARLRGKCGVRCLAWVPGGDFTFLLRGRLGQGMGC